MTNQYENINLVNQYICVCVQLEGGETEVLDELAPDHASDYLSCDSRAASDYEDTDGEAYTDGELGELYTDNEDIDDPFSPPEDVARHSRSRGTALARSSEPARDRDSPSPSPSPEPHLSPAPAPEAEPVYQLPPDGLPPILYVPKPQSQLPPSYSPPRQDAPSPRSRSFSDSDYSATEIQVPTTPSDGPPDFQAPDPRPKGAEPPPESPPPPPVTLSFIEEKLQQVQALNPPLLILYMFIYDEEFT